MSSPKIPKYLQQVESLTLEGKELISTLPRQNGWLDSSYLYLYQGFWYQPDHLQAVISCQKHFRARDSDVFLVTYPKCGTTWLKAIIFTLLNREQFPPAAKTHPLLRSNPHELVLSLEIDLYADNQVPEAAASSPSRRFFSTHMPHASLPESVKSSASKCKVVYACRNPKDTFVSLWHFMNKLRLPETSENDMERAFGMFCDGVVGYGPFWDHVLEYWRQSSRVLFVRYEDVKEEPAEQLRRLAEFLECPFSAEEEAAGVVDQILGLTSFESMSGSEVNRVGRLGNGMENRHFFRQGMVGDWKNFLSAQMAQKLDQIVEHRRMMTDNAEETNDDTNTGGSNSHTQNDDSSSVNVEQRSENTLQIMSSAQGILSSQRSESTNHALGFKAKKTTNLAEFYGHFKQTIERWRSNELSNEFQCIRGQPMTALPMTGIIEQASKVYTITVFKDFEKQFMRCLAGSFSLLSEEYDFKLYQVKDGQHTYQVSFYNVMNTLVTCTCNLFEECGMLCSHCLRILLTHSIDKIPDCYINKRWTKLAKQALWDKNIEQQSKSAQPWRHL